MIETHCASTRATPLPGEELVPLTAVPGRFSGWLPRRLDGKTFNPSTFWRWGTVGKPIGDGRRVKLRAVHVGRTLSTCESWLRAFFAELKGGDRG